MLHGILVNPAPVKAFRGGGEGYLSTQVFTGTKPAQTRPSSSSQNFSRQISTAENFTTFLARTLF
jgi:hypothetical protein